MCSTKGLNGGLTITKLKKISALSAHFVKKYAIFAIGIIISYLETWMVA